MQHHPPDAAARAAAQQDSLGRAVGGGWYRHAHAPPLLTDLSWVALQGRKHMRGDNCAKGTTAEPLALSFDSHKTKVSPSRYFECALQSWPLVPVLAALHRSLTPALCRSPQLQSQSPPLALAAWRHPA